MKINVNDEVHEINQRNIRKYTKKSANIAENAEYYSFERIII